MIDFKRWLEVAPYQRIWPECPKCLWYYAIFEVNTNTSNQVGGDYNFQYICSRKGCDQEEFVKELPEVNTFKKLNGVKP